MCHSTVAAAVVILVVLVCYARRIRAELRQMKALTVTSQRAPIEGDMIVKASVKMPVQPKLTPLHKPCHSPTECLYRAHTVAHTLLRPYVHSLRASDFCMPAGQERQGRVH